MNRDRLWQHIHIERAVLHEKLTGLPADSWTTETLCPGWTVLDVAAHVISNPQIGLAEIAAMVGRNFGRGYNTMILRETKRWAENQTPESVLADFERFADSRKHVPVTTAVEPLLDVLVHTQDILRPLGLHHVGNPEAAAIAADRARLHARMMGWRSARGLRLVATDVTWSRGSGPLVSGPINELLLLLTGRSPDPHLLIADERTYHHV